MKKNAHDVPVPTFEVCVPVPNGLAIKQNLVDYWNGIESFQLEVGELVKKHNAKYNPHGIKRGASEISKSEGGGGLEKETRVGINKGSKLKIVTL